MFKEPCVREYCMDIQSVPIDTFRSCREQRKPWVSAVLSQCLLLTWATHAKDPRASDQWRKGKAISSSSLDVDGVCRKCWHNFLPSAIHGLKIVTLETSSSNSSVLFALLCFQRILTLVWLLHVTRLVKSLNVFTSIPEWEWCLFFFLKPISFVFFKKLFTVPGIWLSDWNLTYRSDRQPEHHCGAHRKTPDSDVVKYFLILTFPWENNLEVLWSVCLEFLV